MRKYASILDSVICLSEIKKIKIVYNYEKNFGNNWVHSLFITYMDGTEEEYRTTDYEKAKEDYENLKSALLGINVSTHKKVCGFASNDS